MGIGTFFAKGSEDIPRFFGATWALDNTRKDGALYHIRQERGWETVMLNGDYAVIRKKLI